MFTFLQDCYFIQFLIQCHGFKFVKKDTNFQKCKACLLVKEGTEIYFVSCTAFVQSSNDNYCSVHVCALKILTKLLKSCYHTAYKLPIDEYIYRYILTTVFHNSCPETQHLKKITNCLHQNIVKELFGYLQFSSEQIQCSQSISDIFRMDQPFTSESQYWSKVLDFYRTVEIPLNFYTWVDIVCKDKQINQCLQQRRINAAIKLYMDKKHISIEHSG
jgi:hypothetical protein